MKINMSDTLSELEACEAALHCASHALAVASGKCNRAAIAIDDEALNELADRLSKCLGEVNAFQNKAHYIAHRIKQMEKVS